MSQIICLHIEYKEARYSYFGRVYLDRNDILFALFGGGPLYQLKPCYELRGMPHDENLLTFMAWSLRVEEQETNRERSISRVKAERWVRDGDARWVGTGTNFITDPDYFSPSWLSTDELKRVYEEYRAHDQPGLASVEATLAAMQSLPEARMVYWSGN